MDALAFFQFFQGYGPKDGPRLMTQKHAVSNGVAFNEELNLTTDLASGAIEWLQSAFVDNSDNPNPLYIYVGISQQRIIIPAGSQGVFPIMAPNPATLIIATAAPAAGFTFQITYTNVPMPYMVWGAAADFGPVIVELTAILNVLKGSAYTDFSGTLAADTDTVVIAANANRKRIMIVNTDPNETIYINFGAAAGAGGSPDPGAMPIYANGGSYGTGAPVTESPQDIHLWSLNGAPFVAKEM